MRSRFFVAAAFTALTLAAAASAPAFAGSAIVQTLKNPPPEGAQLSYLLTDGTVLVQSGTRNERFWVLTPDINGSYVNGTWKRVGNLPAGYSPTAGSSAVLADGRALFEGGEYNFGKFTLSNLGAVFDPTTGLWTAVAPPKGWQNIGDSPSVVLPNGHYLLGDKLHMRVADLDPKTLKWTEPKATGKLDFNAEEGWTLMPDGSLLTVDVLTHPQSEMYNPSQSLWTSLGSTIADLTGPPCCSCIHYPPSNKCYNPPGETGPAILRPDGSVLATGALRRPATAGHTATYKPGTGWVAGPDFPNGDDAGDNFAVLLTNGDVLAQATSGRLYELNGVTIVDTGATNGGGLMMMLPTGQVLLSGTKVLNSSGAYQAAWQPAISSAPSAVTRGATYKISGTQFNGLSQANAFGDELQIATNYPLVRITNNSTLHVFYARTHHHSTMGVATGSTPVSTNFDVPAEMETGASSLVVVANGIPSNPVSITVN